MKFRTNGVCSYSQSRVEGVGERGWDAERGRYSAERDGEGDGEGEAPARHGRHGQSPVAAQDLRGGQRCGLGVEILELI